MSFFRKRKTSKALDPRSFESIPHHNSPESFLPTIFTTHKKSKLRSFAIDKPDFAKDFMEGVDQVIKIRTASTRERAQATNLLIKKMYSSRGYEGSAIDLSSLSLQLKEEWKRKSNEVTLVVANLRKVLGTVTVRYDSPSKMACDELYQEEVDSLRAQGRQLCELTKLAVDRASGSKQIFAALIHMAYIYARLLHDCTDALMEVTPKHARFYKDMLGAYQIGPAKLCPRVNTTGILLRLDGQYMDLQIEKWGGVGSSTTNKSLYPYFFSGNEEARIVQRLLGQ